MIQENILTVIAANLASLPFRLAEIPPYQKPKKALILKTGELAEVLLATPLLAALRNVYPHIPIDWAVNEEGRPAIASNPRITSLIHIEPINAKNTSWRMIQEIIARLGEEEYDTCFIPDRSSLASYIAWQAGIPQRIGLDVHGRGFAHTEAVRPPRGLRNEVESNLELARAVGIDKEATVEFFPTDLGRVGIMEKLTFQTDWDKILPLVVLYPGTGDFRFDRRRKRCWPADRFASLADRLVRKYGASVVIAGLGSEKSLAESIVNLSEEKITNLAGRINIGELGALCEIADLYVGNDSGPTHIAAAVGCPTVAIFGPTDPKKSGLENADGKVRVLKAQSPWLWFNWDGRLNTQEVIETAENLLGERRGIKSIA